MRDAPDPLNPPVAVTEPAKVAFCELFRVKAVVPLEPDVKNKASPSAPITTQPTPVVELSTNEI